LILKGFAVYAEAAVVVEVECVHVPVWGRWRSGWAGRRRVVGMSGWHNRPSELGCGNGMGLGGGWCGGIEGGCHGMNGITGGVLRGSGKFGRRQRRWSFGLRKWRVMSDEWRVVCAGCGRSRFLASLGMTIHGSLGSLGMTIHGSFGSLGMTIHRSFGGL